MFQVTRRQKSRELPGECEQQRHIDDTEGTTCCSLLLSKQDEPEKQGCSLIPGQMSHKAVRPHFTGAAEPAGGGDPS